MLRGVDFDVARGSIFALLGSNGAGKTTIVRILSTLLEPDAGTATVDGFDVATHPAQVRESISLTGQFAAVDEILTGRENLVLVARLRHLKDAGRIADELLARFQLTDAAGATGGDVLRRDAPPPGHRHEPDRGPAGDLPRRTDHRARPAVPRRGVEERQGARRTGHHGAAHHPVPGRGRAARRPDRDPPRGTDHRERHPRRAEAAPPAGQGRVRREAADPGGRLPRRRRRATRPTGQPRWNHDDDHALLRRHRRPARPVPAPHHAQPGHHHHRRDHADRPHAAVRLRVRRRDRHRVGSLRELPAARDPAHHDRDGHLLHRVPALHGHAERDLRAVPVHADRPLERAVGARADLGGLQPDLARGRRARRPPHGLPLTGGGAGAGWRSPGSWSCSPWR